MPVDWRRQLSVTSVPNGMAWSFVDDVGKRHELQVVRGEVRALVRRGDYGFSYRGTASEADTERYRALFESLDATPREWARAIEAAKANHERREEPSRAVVFIDEVELVARARASLLRPRDVIRRWLRRIPDDEAIEVHLYFHHPCAQACEFCEQPLALKTVRGRAVAGLASVAYARGSDAVGLGLFNALLEVLSARAPGSSLCVTGHDWCSHPRLGQILERLAAQPRLPVRFLGPSTALSDVDLAKRVGALPNLERVTLTLQSADPQRHDASTGAPGAAKRVMTAIDNLIAERVTLEINVVLTRRSTADLPALMRWADGRGVQLQLLAFWPDRGHTDAFAPSVARMDDVRRALESASEVETVIDSISVLALCAVPARLRSRVSPAWPGQRREARVYGPACASCGLRRGCPGVPQTYEARHGWVGLVPDAHPNADDGFTQG